MNCPKFRSMIAKAAASVSGEGRRGAKGRPSAAPRRSGHSA
jgi:hypothetical protein